MKQILLIFSIGILLVSCKSNPSPLAKSEMQRDSIKVYYFHTTIRCETCMAIENETLWNIETLFPEQYKAQRISFTTFNLDEEAGKKMAEELNVSGKTLLIIRGEKRIDLTDDGFNYALSDPLSFKSVIKENIDSLL
ncbi:MAG: hypothetical protein H6540_02610 [Bacteroidales bacterium]|nr:hypothetical protein [Bacteroidales bacterium]